MREAGIGWRLGDATPMGRIDRVGGLAAILLAAGLALSPSGAAQGAPGTPLKAQFEALAAPVVSLTELALKQSGYRHLVAPKTKLRDWLRQEESQFFALPNEKDRAKALLKQLHGPRGLLKRYDPKAHTLKDVLEEGRFNCVSSTLLYNLLARQIGLDTASELQPTHVRAQLRSAQTPVIIETTAKDGFAPDPARLRRIASVVSEPKPGERALVGPEGRAIAQKDLIAVMLINVATEAQAKGKLRLAEARFKAAGRIAEAAPIQRVIHIQRAGLLAAISQKQAKAGELLGAYQSLSQAIRLQPDDLQLLRLMPQNLRAIADQSLDEATKKGPMAIRNLLAELLQGPLRPDDRAGLRALAHAEEARLWVAQGKLREAAVALRLGLEEKLSLKDAELGQNLAHNWVAVMRLWAEKEARRGQAKVALARLREAQTLASAADREAISRDRVRVYHLAAEHHLDQGQKGPALRLYRDAHRANPEDLLAKQNLIALLSQMIGPLIEADRCKKARPLILELKSLAPLDPLVRFSQDACRTAGRPQS